MKQLKLSTQGISGLVLLLVLAQSSIAEPTLVTYVGDSEPKSVGCTLQYSKDLKFYRANTQVAKANNLQEYIYLCESLNMTQWLVSKKVHTDKGMQRCSYKITQSFKRDAWSHNVESMGNDKNCFAWTESNDKSTWAVFTRLLPQLVASK